MRYAFILQKTTVAGWREFKDNPLPSVGLIETTNGFAPFTGRSRQHHGILPAVVSRRDSDIRICGADNVRQQRPSNLNHLETDHRQSLQGHLHRGLRLQQEETGRAQASHDFLVRPGHCLHQPVSGSAPTGSAGGELTAPVGVSQETNSSAFRQDLGFPLSRSAAPSPACADIHLPVAVGVQVQISSMSHQSYNSPPISPLSTSPTSSLFTIRPQDAVSLVRSVQKDDDSRHCYFIHLTLRPLFSDDVIPGTCLRKLPRLINGIPLGPGFLSNDQITEIKWRLVEGGHSILTFISSPLMRQEAEESKRRLKERLLKQAQAIFGDLTVNVRLVLSRCLDFDDDLILNDIAVNFGEGLHFRD